MIKINNPVIDTIKSDKKGPVARLGIKNSKAKQ